MLDLSGALNTGGPRGANLTRTAENDLLTTGDGADSVTGGLGGNVLPTGCGDDTIIASGLGQDTIDAGLGDDRITVAFGNMPVGRLDGGGGTDTLVTGARDLTGATLLGFEVLHTQNGTVTARAAQFEGFDIIRVGDGSPSERQALVTLTLAVTGSATVLNLASELNSGGGPRRAFVTGCADAEQITTGDGNDQISGQGGGDRIFAGLGDDVISLHAHDVIEAQGGGGSNDLFVIQPDATLAGADGIVTGDDGNETLQGDVSLLTGLQLSQIEVLHTGGVVVSGFAAQFEQFDSIRVNAPSADATVKLALVLGGATAVLDLSDELSAGGTRGVELAGTVADETVTTGDGNESLALGGGNDVAHTGGGADVITDSEDQTLSVEAGLVDDRIIIDHGLFTAGSIDGGIGSDALSAEGVDLSLLTLTGLEALNTGTGLHATANQLEGFNILRFDAAHGSDSIRLQLVASGRATALN